MDFKPLTLNEVSAVKPFFSLVKSRTCDFTVGGMFMWRDYYGMQYKISDNTFYSRMRNENGESFYNLPLSRDIEKSIAGLIKSKKREGEPIRFCTIPEDYLDAFRSLSRNIKITEQENFFDYLYNASDLMNFSGKKYHGQRNLTSQFKRHFDTWEFKLIDNDSLSEIRAFFRDSYLPNASDGSFEAEENRKVFEVLSNYEKYDMRGGFLTANGKTVAFTIQEVVGDTLFNHIEKADRNIKGAYQMIVSQSARAFATQGIKYINREEDAGDPGLRTSKQSYHPVKLLHKYIVEIN